MSHNISGFLLESPRFTAVREEQEKAAKVLENISWMNGKDLVDGGVLRTTTEYKTSKSGAASGNGIIELLTQITRSINKGFNCPECQLNADSWHRIR